MINKLTYTKQFLAKHQLACFIVGCIAIALVMTSISLELYRRSGAIKLDMSRPGFERVRREVEKSTDDQPFSSSGTIDAAAIKDFNSRIDKYSSDLHNMGGYGATSIEDDDLNLSGQSDSINQPSQPNSEPETHPQPSIN